MNIVELLKELEESFPDRLPTRAKLTDDPLKTLCISVGQQEVIRKIQGILTRDKT